MQDCTITVKVWDNDGPRGLPGTVLGSVNVDAKATGDWFDVDISSLGLKIDSGSFYAGWVEGDNTYYNGLDVRPPLLPPLVGLLSFVRGGHLLRVQVCWPT